MEHTLTSTASGRMLMFRLQWRQTNLPVLTPVEEAWGAEAEGSGAAEVLGAASTLAGAAFSFWALVLLKFS